MRRFTIPDIDMNSSEIAIDEIQTRHLKNVLRMKEGDHIILVSGSGIELTGIIREFRKNSAIIEVTEKKYVQEPSLIKITAAFAVLKESKVDDLIRPLTELGIHEILPFISERSVSRPDPEKVPKKTERWNKIASESIKQCRRSLTPVIEFKHSLLDVITHCGEHDKKVIFYENSSGETLFKDFVDSGFKRPQKLLFIIGPEGGFSDREYETCLQNGFETYPLGKHILRAETAVVAAASIIQYLYII